MNSLKGKLIKGGFWVGLQRASTMLFNFLKLTLLTHFLTPKQFGIFGVALISLEVLGYFSTIGFNQALIFKKGDVTPFLNSAWTFRILRSILLAIILFTIAPAAATFFEYPEAVQVIRAISGVYLIGALVNIADIYLHKNLDFKTLFFYLLGGNVIDFILAVVFAFILKNYWALFIGYTGKYIFKCIISYVIFDYRPKIELHFNRIKELFSFGKWVLGYSIVIVLAMYLDNILVGKLIGLTALGIYQVAFKFSHTGSGELNNMVSQLYFPYFSALQDDNKAAESAFLKMFKLSMVVMLFLVSGMICLAPSFTVLFLNQKWHSIVGIIQILSVASLFNSVVSTGTPFFKGKGLPKYMLYAQLVKVVSMFVFIFLLAKSLGVKGISYSVVIAEVLAAFIWFITIQKMIPGFFVKALKIVIPPIIAASIMAGIISLFWIIPQQRIVDLNIWEFLISGSIGTLVFVGLMYVYIKIKPDYGTGITWDELKKLFVPKRINK